MNKIKYFLLILLPKQIMMKYVFTFHCLIANSICQLKIRPSSHQCSACSDCLLVLSDLSGKTPDRGGAGADQCGIPSGQCYIYAPVLAPTLAPALTPTPAPAPAVLVAPPACCSAVPAP